MGLFEDTGISFRCLICLELVFKPVVQSCGHVFCFWCVHRAMNRTRQSQCPLCRRRYIHFPQVCELLHFFLMKAKPEEYNRRAQEIQDVEESNNVFSPRIVESPKSAGSPCECSESRQLLSPRLDPISPLEQTHLHRGQLLDSTSGTHLAEYNSGNNELPVVSSREGESGSSAIGSEEDLLLHEKGLDSGTTDSSNFPDGRDDDCGCSISLTVEDFQCASCKNFLYRPVVLNCGQVFCESCLGNYGKAVSCPSCEGPQPVTLVQVCLELHHYLEGFFPAEYSKRKEDVFSQRDPDLESEIAETIDVDLTVDDGEEGQFIHVGAGCDRCGVKCLVSWLKLDWVSM
eukprot:c8826_g1_i2 orf=679-1710(-)